jgi:hypothetical protein
MYSAGWGVVCSRGLRGRPSGLGGRVLQTIVAAACLGLAAFFPAAAQETPGESDRTSAEGVVEELYELVTFQAGTTPDWDVVRSLFLPEAVVVLRTSRTETTVYSVDGFVQSFVDFIEASNVEATGFSERIVRVHPIVFGDMAHVWVLYEAQITGSPRPPQQGVDGFQLIRREGRWWIVSITNELPTAERPVPGVLGGGG